jgi:hypothetical protein
MLSEEVKDNDTYKLRWTWPLGTSDKLVARLKLQCSVGSSTFVHHSFFALAAHIRRLSRPDLAWIDKDTQVEDELWMQDRCCAPRRPRRG